MKSKKVNKENEEIVIEEQEVQSSEVEQEEVSSDFEKDKIRRRIVILPIILSITGIIAVWIGAWLISYVIGSITQRVIDLTEVNGAEMSNFGEIFKNELTKISYVMLAFGGILIIAGIALLVVSIILVIKDFKNRNKKLELFFIKYQEMLEESEQFNLKLDNLNWINQENLNKINLLNQEIAYLRKNNNNSLAIIQQQKAIEKVAPKPQQVPQLQQPKLLINNYPQINKTQQNQQVLKKTVVTSTQTLIKNIEPKRVQITAGPTHPATKRSLIYQPSSPTKR
ncbi:unique hypothetical protein [Mycoplasmoides gallisepticum str. R(low)]|uniref:Transmembrane protein n=1 Tax=Mycoplasmoides gallisepticum (strain R(low / passage 15 / clone 2)) TaxID=710127 RepID=Q7NAH0_MYCGA|nr:hypothetical protein [Mycoplasmoides gallisepticum]AAP57037.1 unique hypothetical protein [Mycoplasmoides gallisepticum str. R(low)]ADC30906.1 hypothetical protein MGAH_0551 [Mycoplasmoides gallisepticum str. R(high)]